MKLWKFDIREMCACCCKNLLKHEAPEEILWKLKFDVRRERCVELVELPKPESFKVRSSEVAEPQSSKDVLCKDSPVQRLGEIRHEVVRSSEAQSFGAPKSEAPDEHISAKRLDIALGHMRLQLK
jgi:hypothetical protein